MSILDSIKEAEEEAQKIKQDAALEARNYILCAEKEAQVLSVQKIADAQKKAETILSQAKSRTEEKVKNFLSEKRAQDAGIFSSAEQKSGEAVNYIVERIDML